MEWFHQLNPIAQALLATIGTWLITAPGAALVIFAKGFSPKYLDASLGLAAGVMIAARFWSLLAPAMGGPLCRLRDSSGVPSERTAVLE